MKTKRNLQQFAAQMASMAWRASPAATAVKWSNGQWQRQPHLTLISDAIAEMADHPIRLLLSIPSTSW